jgi:nucleoside-diphosphate-sugar epimerase
MVYTSNLVQGARLAEVVERAPGHAYWIADAEPYPLADIISTVRDALAAEGLDVSSRAPRTMPRVAAELAARADAVLQSAGRYVQPLHVLGELKDTIASDISRARKELGYEPKVALYEGMRASVRWCLEQGWQL